MALVSWLHRVLLLLPEVFVELALVLWLPAIFFDWLCRILRLVVLLPGPVLDRLHRSVLLRGLLIFKPCGVLVDSGVERISGILMLLGERCSLSGDR